MSVATSFSDSPVHAKEECGSSDPPRDTDVVDAEAATAAERDHTGLSDGEVDEIAHTEADFDLVGRHLAWRAEALALQEQLRAAAVHASLGGPELELFLEDGYEDPEELQLLVHEMLQELLLSLEACQQNLERVQVDLECLDDGGAESLFGSPGKLKSELTHLQAVHKACEALQTRTKSWVRCFVQATGNAIGLEALADFVDEAVAVKDSLLLRCGECAARRRAAVARAKAAIEAAGAEERASAAGLLQEALSPQSRVDFPCVTEICQRVADRPEEAEASADLLFSALASKEDSSPQQNERAEAPRRKLKALTIAHELLYDERVLQEFASRPLDPLRSLEALPQGSGLGAPAEETIRMLASEVRRRVEEAQVQHSRRLRKAKTWSFVPLKRNNSAAASTGGDSPDGSSLQPQLTTSLSAPLEVASWEGDGQGSLRGRAGAEALFRSLRRWGSWYRWGTCQEAPVLEDIQRTFKGYLDALSRLHEELHCLDDGSTGLPLHEQLLHMEPLLLAASDVQARALAWKQALPSCGIDKVAGIDAEKLSDFFEEALAASEEMHRRLQGFTALRKEAVERAKAAIEAGPVLQLQPKTPSSPLVDWC
eukprot:TRINITY_DN20916_c0_g1_i2.p1 TRINITY_DN20916_c0_g1~~TRINITY_DN20916_c0_g1_i2.p1  ORF type:complete len:693 (-),score=184.47 TRINITY_DN20916_c0_g1_i2:67-1863(-)